MVLRFFIKHLLKSKVKFPNICHCNLRPTNTHKITANVAESIMFSLLYDHTSQLMLSIDNFYTATGANAIFYKCVPPNHARLVKQRHGQVQWLQCLSSEQYFACQQFHLLVFRIFQMSKFKCIPHQFNITFKFLEQHPVFRRCSKICLLCVLYIGLALWNSR